MMFHPSNRCLAFLLCLLSIHAFSAEFDPVSTSESELKILSRYFDEGEYGKIVPRARELLRENPENVGALSALGRSLIHMGKIQEARENLEKAVALAPNFPYPLIYLGEAWAEEDLNKAISFWDQALAMEPPFKDAFLQVSRITADNDLFSKTAEVITRAVELFPDDPNILFSYAYLIDLQGDHTAALELYLRLIGQYPNHSDALARAAVIFRQGAQYDTALELVSRALAVDPGNGLAYFVKGLVFGDRGEYEEAASEFEKALRNRLPPIDKFVTLQNLGAMYSTQGKYDDAINRTKQAVQFGESISETLGKGYLSAYSQLGLLYYTTKQPTLAKEALLRRFDLDKSRKTNDYLILGTIYSREGNKKEALKVIEAGLNEYPDNMNLLYNKAGIFADLERNKEAEELFKKIGGMEPQNQKEMELVELAKEHLTSDR